MTLVSSLGTQFLSDVEPADVQLNGTFVMQAGEIYQAEYSVSGLATMISSTWQQDALSNVQTNVENNGGQVVYIALDDGGNGFLQGGTITVQFKQAQSVEGSTTSVLSTQSAGMRAAQIWEGIVIDIIVLAVPLILAWWFSTSIVGDVKDLGNEAASSPYAAVAIYGALAIVGLLAASYFLKQYHSGKLQMPQYISSPSSASKGTEIIEYM